MTTERITEYHVQMLIQAYDEGADTQNMAFGDGREWMAVLLEDHPDIVRYMSRREAYDFGMEAARMDAKTRSDT